MGEWGSLTYEGKCVRTKDEYRKSVLKCSLQVFANKMYVVLSIRVQICSYLPTSRGRPTKGL